MSQLPRCFWKLHNPGVRSDRLYRQHCLEDGQRELGFHKQVEPRHPDRWRQGGERSGRLHERLAELSERHEAGTSSAVYPPRTYAMEAAVGQRRDDSLWWMLSRMIWLLCGSDTFSIATMQQSSDSVSRPTLKIVLGGFAPAFLLPNCVRLFHHPLRQYAIGQTVMCLSLWCRLLSADTQNV